MKTRFPHLLATAAVALAVLCTAAPLVAQAQTRGLTIAPTFEERSLVVTVTNATPLPMPANESLLSNEAKARLRAEVLNQAKDLAVARAREMLRTTGVADGDVLMDKDPVTPLKTKFLPADDGKLGVVLTAEVKFKLAPPKVSASPGQQPVSPPSAAPAAPAPDKPVAQTDKPGEDKSVAAPDPSSTSPAVPPTEDPAAFARALKDPNGPLTVAIWTDAAEYKQGETMVVRLQGNKDFYAKITYQDADGQIIQILPNKFRDSARFKGGEELKIPDTGDRFQMKVTGPYGKERFTVYASNEPIPPIETKPADPTTGVLQSDNREAITKRTRGLSIEAADEKPAASQAAEAPTKELYTREWTVTTSQ